ncbi:hypothetical protein [Streptococcus saliviloxodontae]|uniref:Uncharacterized protein n=1 Tax=Streptococcus saliviloxodontae TaxID=1349416 RepID=A0ABS2PJX3_9STRE|nr:hypothetical protein [Streptococcus saliviloxodontae]MBM7635735.1 hypothetical protein [Streptococcus saliviloxodontae]
MKQKSTFLYRIIGVLFLFAIAVTFFFLYIGKKDHRVIPSGVWESARLSQELKAQTEGDLSYLGDYVSQSIDAYLLQQETNLVVKSDTVRLVVSYRFNSDTYAKDYVAALYHSSQNTTQKDIIPTESETEKDLSQLLTDYAQQKNGTYNEKTRKMQQTILTARMDSVNHQLKLIDVASQTPFSLTGIEKGDLLDYQLTANQVVLSGGHLKKNLTFNRK